MVRSPAGSRGAVDVLVAGAGPTGLMAATLLRRCGVSVRIVDKAPTASKESRAFGVQPRSLELFDKIGLADAMLDRGLLASGAQVFVDGRQAAQLDFDDIGRSDTPYGFLLMVPQSEIEALLVADLERLGTAVERDVELTGFRQDDERVRAETSVGTIEARFLLGADGAHSVVRKGLGLSFEGAPYAQTFLLADCRVTWPLDHDHLKIMLSGRSFGLFLPLKGRETSRVMVTDPHPDGAGTRQGGQGVSLGEVEAAFRAASGQDVDLSDPVWTSRYRIHHRGVDRYRVGRVFVAGDAAHIHSPAGGQGMNTGLQDAANLAWKLALACRGGPPPELLDSYHDERWPVGQRVLTYTDRLFSFATGESGWRNALRNALLPLLAAGVSRVGSARARAFHFASQLGIRYDDSPILSEEVSSGAGQAFRDGPGAGHRAPDAAVGRHTRVFDLLQGYGVDVLALSRRPLADGEIGRLRAGLDGLGVSGLEVRGHIVAHSLVGRDARLCQAESSDVFAAYGIDDRTPEALYLIRPDGYVGWRTDSLDLAGARDHLLRALGPAGSSGQGQTG